MSSSGLSDPENAQPTAPADALAAAVIAGDAVRARRVIADHPEIRSTLNDPMANGPFGATPLLCAVGRKSRDVIDVLLSAGADINARSHWWAGSFGVLDGLGPGDELAPFLIERGARVDANAAARLDMLDELTALVAANPQAVHARGGDGQTPLHVSATVRIARFLLDHGADIDAIDVDHESTAAQYVLKDHPDVVRYLISRGCRTDLLMAAALGDLDVARGHLERDPNSIRMSVSERWFPKKDPRAGGSIYIWVLGWNKTPHVLARQFGHSEMFNLLMDHSPDDVKLSVACELGDRSRATSVLARRPELVRSLNDDERVRLVAAAMNNNTPSVRLMLELGWPASVADEGGVTPLHWSAFHGNKDMAVEILRYSPPLEAKDHEHHGTPMGWATFGSQHGWYCKTGDYAGVVEVLLSAGAVAPPADVDASAAVKAVLAKR